MRSVIVILCVLVGAGSCGGDSSGPGGPRTLSILAGDGTSAPVDTDVGVKVKLVDGKNQPVPGATVTWTVTAGDGATITPSSATSSDGSATATWHLGKKAGQQQVQASASGATPVTVSSTALPRDAATISLTPTDATLKAGTTVQLQVTAKDAFDNVIPNAVLAWSSSAESIASVSPTAVVTGKLIGDATLTGRAGTAEARATVHVIAGDAVSFSLTPAVDTLRSMVVNVQLVATLKDAGGNSLPLSPITWVSSDTTVLQVSSAGLVSPRHNGQATITATMGTRVATAVVTVSVAAASLQNIRFNPTTVPNTPQKWEVSPREANGLPIDVPVTFTVSDTSVVALVGQSGSVLTYFGLKPGRVTLTAQSGTARLDMQLEVTDDTQYFLYPRAAIVFHSVGTTQELSMKTVHDGAPVAYSGTEPLVWRSSDSSVATVADDGTVEAIGDGAATITATTATARAEATITVASSAGLHVTTGNVTLGSGFGATMQLVPEGAAAAVSWNSSNQTVVTVTADGSITGLRASQATVTASDGAHSDAVNVTVIGAPASIELLYPAPPSMQVGSNAQILAYAYDSMQQRLDYGVESLPMTSSDPTIVRVFGSYLYAVRAGTAIITLRAGTLTRTFSIDVR